ncbi:MAG: helix-turn-helix domain-containing protein [Gammaproteobacteria bacterium]|jgi:transcriptional regulator with XRE-family HTH domain
MNQALKVNAGENESLEIAKNLSNLLKSHNLNVNQLAQELGIPMMTIRRLALGKTVNPRIATLKLIADYFNITVDSLLEWNNQEIIKNSQKAVPRFVPILTWETIKKIKTIKDLNLTNWKEWQPVSLGNKSAISTDAFALESKPSMYPRFPQETLFIIDPNIHPADGDIVLVKIKDSNEVTLRELTIDPPERLLHPLTAGSAVLSYSDKLHETIGVNTLTMLYNKRIHG